MLLGTPKRGRRFGGSATHQRALMSNLVVSLIAAEGIVTTEAKAKALRPTIEKLVTKAKHAHADPSKRVHLTRQVNALVQSNDMGHQRESLTAEEDFMKKLFDVLGPRYADRPGGYTRILKLGSRLGDAAPMARIEFV
jgi:large subunit ribosomal protein L17